MSVGTGLFVSYPGLEDLGRSLNLCLSFFTCEVGISFPALWGFDNT